MSVIRCFDCGRQYGDEHGFPDLVVAHEVWNTAISPTGYEGGLLCPSCMCKRAYEAGLTGVPARFTSGPFVVEPSVEVAALLAMKQQAIDKLWGERDELREMRAFYVAAIEDYIAAWDAKDAADSVEDPDANLPERQQRGREKARAFAALRRTVATVEPPERAPVLAVDRSRFSPQSPTALALTPSPPAERERAR